MTQVAKTAKSQEDGKKKKKGLKGKLSKKKFKSEEEKIISRLDRLKNEIDVAQCELLPQNFSSKKTKKKVSVYSKWRQIFKVEGKSENGNPSGEIIGKEKKRRKKKNEGIEEEKMEVPEIERIEVEKMEVTKKENNEKVEKVKKKKKVKKEQNDKLAVNKDKKITKKEKKKKIVKLKNKETEKKENKPLEIKENEKTEKKKKKEKIKKLAKKKIKAIQMTEKKKKKNKNKENKTETNVGKDPLEDATIKTELLDLESSNDNFLQNLNDINLNCLDDIKPEPPDSDDADGSGPEGFSKSDPIFMSGQKSSGEMLPENGFYLLEPGEAIIKTESDVLYNTKIKKEDNEIEKKGFLICFRNLIKGSEEEKIKELSYRVLDPIEIVDLFLVKDRKKRFGFLKVATREALEKVLKLDGWAVDGRIIKVTESNLINIKKNPPLLNHLNLTPPPEPKKRKLDDLDRDVIEEKVIEKHIDEILGGVKKNIEVQEVDEGKNIEIKGNAERKLCMEIKDDAEGKLCQRYSAFLGNINYDTSDEQIRTFLESIVAPAKITRLHRAKKRSIAFVDLEDKETLERVLKLNESKLMGRSVRIQVAGGKTKKRPFDSTESTEKSGKRPFKKIRDFSAKPKSKKFKKS